MSCPYLAFHFDRGQVDVLKVAVILVISYFLAHKILMNLFINFTFNILLGYSIGSCWALRFLFALFVLREFLQSVS